MRSVHDANQFVNHAFLPSPAPRFEQSPRLPIWRSISWAAPMSRPLTSVPPHANRTRHASTLRSARPPSLVVACCQHKVATCRPSSQPGSALSRAMLWPTAPPSSPCSAMASSLSLAPAFRAARQPMPLKPRHRRRRLPPLRLLAHPLLLFPTRMTL